MPRPAFPPAPDPDRFTRRNTELLALLDGADPSRLAERAGAQFETSEQGGLFRLLLWGQAFGISYPGYECRWLESGKPAGMMDQALLLYYLTSADGTPLDGRWISFADLPDGRFYNQAFQGYTGQELARAFRDDLPAFCSAAERSGGESYPLGDAAFAFQALPRVPVLAVFWLGDEDFPASAQVLFDAAASHYLPTDAYAILGSTLTRRLIKARAG